MKKKNLVRKKQLYQTEIDNLCFAAAICHELFMSRKVWTIRNASGTWKQN